MSAPVYCTPADLLEKLEAVELAQAACALGSAPCRADVLAALIKGVPPPGDATPDQIAIATEALATITAECDRASRRIDMRLRVRYELPFANPQPPELLGLAIDISRYFLHDQRASEEIRKRYEDAMAELGLIASGQSGLTLPPEGPTPVAATPIYSEAFPRTITYDRLRWF